MDYALIVVGVFGLLLSVPTAVILWAKLLSQPSSPLKRYLLVRFALVKPVMWIGFLLAGIGGRGPLRPIGWALAAIGAIGYVVLMVVGRAFLRRWGEQGPATDQ